LRLFPFWSWPNEAGGNHEQANESDCVARSARNDRETRHERLPFS
jgi:hypothetical protein